MTHPNVRPGPLWTCPECGHRFVTRNLWHSCGNYPLDAHFGGKDPHLREVFDRYVALVRKFGPFTVYAQKTRIVFQVRVRFAGAVIRKHWIQGTFWLTREVDAPGIDHVEFIPPRYHVYRFRAASTADLAHPMLRKLLREAYDNGLQRHLEAPREAAKRRRSTGRRT